MSTQNKEKTKWENDLKRYRTNKGYSQNDLALAVGLSQNTIHQIEKGNLSGRKHMDAISTILKTDGALIFPYYDFLTYSEAAWLLNVSSTLIAKRVEDGTLPIYVLGGIKMVKKSELFVKSVKKRGRKGIRVTILSYLAEKNGAGATVDELLSLFGPFTDKDSKEKRKKSIQSILSRSDEFEVNKNISPPRWFLGQ